jgi:methionine-rich copper-binding protein CopC
VLAAACAPALAAPPRLVAVWPSAGAKLPVAPHTFELTFNRALRADASSAAVWRDDQDGQPIPTHAEVEPTNPRRLRVQILAPSTGRYRLHWHAVADRTAAMRDGEQGFSMRDESVEAPRLQVNRTTAESGEKFEVAGHGFGQDDHVRLTIGDDEQALRTVETNDEGAFVAETQVPAGVAFGVQPISAVDARGNSATAAVQVRWGGWPPLLAFTVGQPGPRPGEVTFSLSVRNRSDYVLEQVRVVLGDPDGASFVAAEPAPQRQDQALAWEIPMVDRGVVGPFLATYRVTGATATHARIEFRHRRPRGCTGDDCLPAFVSETTSDSAPVVPDP